MRKLAGSKIVIATHNKGKLEEFAQLLAPYGVETVSAGQLGLAEPEETETTFEGNARIKATAAMKASGLIALADDSGLCVEALNGEPGVYTADWAGPDRDWNRAMRLVEEKLQARHVTTPDQRRAEFVCTLCVLWPDGEERVLRAAPMATLYGRRAGHWATAMTRCSCRLAAARPSPRSIPPRRTRSRTAPRPWRNWSVSSSEAFGIYVHWPFCKAKCPYCDFNSHVRHQPVDAMSFARALENELAWFAARTPGRTVTSIFFGGGTPSLMPPQAVGHVLDAIGQQWSVSPDVETTLEANPTSIEAENFRGYRAAGINRVSVGVQALNDADLKALGRQHSAEEALAAFRLAAKVFPRVSFDMIYARPGQTPQQWRAELSRALASSKGTCRSTSSPSNPARPTLTCTNVGLW